MSDAAPAPAAGALPRKKRGYLVPGVIALVVCAGLATLIDVAGLQARTPARLAATEAETFLSEAVQARDNLATPPSVRCPGTEPLRAGVSFSCVIRLAGRDHRVRVQEGSGGRLSYEVAAG